MTIKGPDISSFQAGLNVRALDDEFVLMKCTEGTGYADAYYAAWLAQTKASGKIPIAYHFIGPQDPHAQAAFLAAHIIDRSVRVMVDFEDEGPFHPTLAQLLALDDAITAAGLTVKVNYFPRWKWAEIGSPSLSGLTSRSIGLISSQYPGGSGYPGDDASGWNEYGGVTPMLWQYTDVAYEGGQKVGDMNAYRGSIQQLAAFLGVTTSTSSTPQGGTVGTISPAIGQKWPDIAAEFTAGAAFDNDTALIWADAGARAAAVFALEGRDAARAALDVANQIKAQIGQPPAVDVSALAAALAPLISAGAGADDVAIAVVAHLAAQMAKA